jgi:hypothetical protein
MGKINRASLIKSKCGSSANKEFCEGYIDQCIEQRKKIGSDKGQYLLRPANGKEVRLKNFRMCTILAPRLANLMGKPETTSKRASSPKQDYAVLTRTEDESCIGAEDRAACDAYVKMCEELDGKVMVNGREVNLRSVRACKQQAQRFAQSYGMPEASFKSRPISDEEAQEVADSTPEVAAPRVPYLKQVQALAKEAGVKKMPKVSSRWSKKHTTAFDKVPQNLGLKQVLEVQLSKDEKSCLVTTVEGFNVYKHYIAGSDVWDMVAVFEGSKSMKLMDYAELLDPLLQQLFRKGREVTSRKDRPSSKHFYYERQTEKLGSLIEDVRLVALGDEAVRLGKVLAGMKRIRNEDINAMRVELLKSVKMLSMKSADISEQSSWNADNMGDLDRLIP